MIENLDEIMRKKIKADFQHPERIKSKTTIYVENFEQLKEVLSPERLRMLTNLNFPDCRRPPTINGLAKKLGRKRQSVARDLHALEQRGLVGIERKGREAKAVAKAQEVLIRFR